jgi:hypothetical protein
MNKLQSPLKALGQDLTHMNNYLRKGSEIPILYGTSVKQIDVSQLRTVLIVIR